MTTVVNTNQFVLPTDPAARKEIMDMVKEVSGSFTRQEAERDFVKEAIKASSDKHGIPKKMLSKFSRAYHKSSFASVVNENEDFEALVAALVPTELGDSNDQG